MAESYGIIPPCLGSNTNGNPLLKFLDLLLMATHSNISCCSMDSYSDVELWSVAGTI